MKGDPIPDINHVARLCKGSECESGIPQAAAFMLRPADTDGALSTNWLESFGDIGLDAQMAAVRLAKAHMNIRASYRYAILNVGTTRTAIKEGTTSAREIRVLHDPVDEPHPDPSHAGIYNLSQADDMLIEAELLAASVVSVFLGKP